MQLMTKLSYIEEVKYSVQKRYNSLKTELKKDGSIADAKKQRAIIYAKEMMEHANKHYYEVKQDVEQSSRSDRVAKQIARTMISIKSYRQKIHDLCGYEYS
jgi:predicted Holliday junction resolvase-like endonuclease